MCYIFISKCANLSSFLLVLHYTFYLICFSFLMILVLGDLLIVQFVFRICVVGTVPVPILQQVVPIRLLRISSQCPIKIYLHIQPVLNSHPSVFATVLLPILLYWHPLLVYFRYLHSSVLNIGILVMHYFSVLTAFVCPSVQFHSLFFFSNFLRRSVFADKCFIFFEKRNHRL